MPQQSQTNTNDLEALLERTDIQSSLEDQRSMSLTSEVDNDNNKNTGRVRSARHAVWFFTSDLFISGRYCLLWGLVFLFQLTLSENVLRQSQRCVS